MANVRQDKRDIIFAINADLQREGLPRLPTVIETKLTAIELHYLKRDWIDGLIVAVQELQTMAREDEGKGPDDV